MGRLLLAIGLLSYAIPSQAQEDAADPENAMQVAEREDAAGFIEFDKGSSATDVAGQYLSDGLRLIVIGFFGDVSTQDQKLFIARFNITETGLELDTKGFGNGVGYITEKVGRSSRAWGVYVDRASSEIFVSGWGYAAPTNVLLVLHYKPDGTLVGKNTLQVAKWTHGRRLAVDSPTGSLWVAGSFAGLGGADSFVARFRKDLSIDSTGFGKPKGYVVNATKEKDGLTALALYSTKLTVVGSGWNSSQNKGIVETYTSAGTFINRATLSTSPSRYWGIAAGERENKAIIAAAGHETNEMIVDLYDETPKKMKRLPPVFAGMNSVARDIDIEDGIIYAAGHGKDPKDGEDKRYALVALFHPDGTLNEVKIDFTEGISDAFLGLTPTRRPNQVVAVGRVRLSDKEGFAVAIALCDGPTGKPIWKKVWAVPR